MKLKYYLRGLGIGVLVTTIILAIALNNKPMELTDAQIKERARQLGMVEETTSEVKTTKETKSETTKPEADATRETQAETTKTTQAETTTKVTQPETTKVTQAETTQEQTTQVQQAADRPEAGTRISIEIGAYDWSNHVAQKLEEAGLVESASQFDQYLIDNGYEAKIRSGRHTFTMGAGYEELAKELVSRPE